MDINDLQQLNDFGDGMNTDTSDALLSKSSYRMANNLRYITNTSENSGELHMIEGTTLNKVFVDQTIIATTSLRDLEIYVVQANDKSYWKVYTCDNNGLHAVANISAQKDRVIDKRLSLVTRYEDEDNQKLYIADGVGPIIVIQLKGYTEDFDQVVSYPSISLNKPVYCGLVNGSIKAAVVSYSYQLYKKYGQQSEISPSTKLIPLYKGAVTANDSNKVEGYLKDETSDKGVRLKIKLSDKDVQTFDKIKVYRVSYIETGQLPQIECVIDTKISGTQMDIVDAGLTSLQVLSLEEYNSMTGIHIIPRVIESKDDYLFAANIKQNEEYIYNPQWNTILTDIQYKIVTTSIYADDYNEVNYIKQPKIEDDPIYLTLTSSVACDGSQERFDISDYVDVNNNVDVKTYQNSKVSYMFRSLRRGETYRFGIILYNEDGIASPVYYYRDIEIKTDTPIFSKDETTGMLVVHPVGLQFTVNKAKLQELGATHYEIVRCGRSVNDVSTIAQGVLSRPIMKSYAPDGGEQTYPLTPTGFITTNDVVFSNHLDDNSIQDISTNTSIEMDVKRTTPNRDVFQFISPEISYLSDTIKDMIYSNSLQIEPVCYLYPNIEQYGGENDVYNYDGTYNRQLYKFGNEYAKVTYNTNLTSKAKPLKNPIIWIDSPYDPLFCYYKQARNYPLTIDDNIENAFDSSVEKFRYQYAKLYNQNTIEGLQSTYNVEATGFPETLNWDDFATSQNENYQLIYEDKVCAVGGRNFVNWVCGPVFGFTDKYPSEEDGFMELYKADADTGCVMGPGGKCMVLKLDSEDLGQRDDNHFICTYLCNLKRKSNPTQTEEDIKRSTYRSFGDIYSVEDGPAKQFVFDGDCFINVFEYVAQHKFAHTSSKYFRTSCNIYAIPLETSVNLAYTSGFEFSKNYNSGSAITYIQNDAGNVNNIFIQDKPLYLYNSAYSATDTSKTLISVESFEESNDLENTDCRVFHSLQKANNEVIDGWLKFQSANFLDVDTRKGGITQLRRFKNQLVFWQECATGLLSVNERSMISDDSNLPLILGSGGVLTRHDYITDTNGMHLDDFSDTQSNTTLYWWDKANKSICGYSGGQTVVELSKIKFVQNYLNKNDVVEYPDVSYDNKFNEAIFNVVDGRRKEFGSLIYNEQLGKFTGLYSIKPKHHVELPDRILFTSDDTVYNWNTTTGDSVYGFGEPLYPYLKYIVNAQSIYTKVFDNGEFAGRVYGGDQDLRYIDMTFSTPLKQYSELNGTQIQNREYNFKYIVPRNLEDGEQPLYGGRLRGKTMQCEMKSSSNSYDFSLQFIKNRFRISWS